MAKKQAPEKKQPEKDTKEPKSIGVIFVGCMFLGLGVGMLLGSAGPGVLIGMGVGFLAMYFVKK